MNKYSLTLLLLTILLISCSNDKEESTEIWNGKWIANWETLPESYPGITDVDFTMNGTFEFNDQEMTITANGYPGCIFNVDTITHSQLWKVSNDTLFLFNDPKVMSMTYKVDKLSEDSIRLQLMSDIFVTLTK